LLQERLIGIQGVGVARLLPIPFLVQFLHPGLGLSGELAARIALEELFVGIDGVRGAGFFPVALLPAAAGNAEQDRETQYQDRLIDHY
jgi:hypothetical protein